MTTFTYRLPVLAMSLNNAYGNLQRGGRFLTDEGKAFKGWVARMARAAADAQGWQYRAGDRLSVTVYLVPTDKRAWDVDGKAKLLIDAMAEEFGFNDTCVDEQRCVRAYNPELAGQSVVVVETLTARWWQQVMADVSRLVAGIVNPAEASISQGIRTEGLILAAKRKARRERQQAKASVAAGQAQNVPSPRGTPVRGKVGDSTRQAGGRAASRGGVASGVTLPFGVPSSCPTSERSTPTPGRGLR